MANIGKITYKPEEKKELLSEIQAFFYSERDETIGLIAAENVLDFFTDVMAAHIYNKALDDIHLWFKRNMDNIEADYYSLYKNEPIK